ncbi:MAG: right-handed parallel beta-helix repeat-containing protein, partial [Thermoplasmata archaeon]|nr:right-handed parallel beta-helix repeat-containing protein [Thermoplasmata archaeon]
MDNQVRGKIFAFCTVAAMISVSFAMCISMEAKALEFVDSTTIDAPWTSSFTPLDSAWDSSGTQCIVVGNDTSRIQPSAWYYNEPLNEWAPILEGSDPTVKVSHLVENDDTGITYGSIQAAINAAAPGDTLNVWAGTYYENVIVNKTLTLQGNGSANTVIDGGNTGTAVTILADDVGFRGFTVTGGPDHTGILLLNVNYCTVERNNVEGNGDGICISGSSYCTVRDNYVRDNAGVGVKTQESPVMKTLAGLSENGGIRDYGAMYRIDLTGTNYSQTHSFHNGMAEGYPYASPLIQDSSDTNKLYGTTESGGKYSYGTLFTVRKDGSQFKILVNFSQALGGSPQGLVQSGNYLYSTTSWGGAWDY